MLVVLSSRFKFHLLRPVPIVPQFLHLDQELPLVWQTVQEDRNEVLSRTASIYLSSLADCTLISDSSRNRSRISLTSMSYLCLFFNKQYVAPESSVAVVSLPPMMKSDAFECSSALVMPFSSFALRIKLRKSLRSSSFAKRRSTLSSARFVVRSRATRMLLGTKYLA